jgi:DUF971 family protein
MTSAERPWPVELRLHKDRRRLTVTWDDGLSHAFTAEFLRVNSPSAEVQGHGPGQRVTVAGKRDVEIVGVDPVGTYAVRLTFDDLHSTGIYPWDLFRRFARDEAKLWADYLDELAAKNLSREPKRPAQGTAATTSTS